MGRVQTARRGPHEITGIMAACLRDARTFGELVHQGNVWWKHRDSSQKWHACTVHSLLRRGLLEVKVRCPANRAAQIVRPTETGSASSGENPNSGS